MTVKEYAHRFGLSVRAVYYRLRKGKILGFKRKRRWCVVPPEEKKPQRRKTVSNDRNVGFYGTGTPQVAIYGPVGKPYATAASPWVQRNKQPRHWSLEMPEGEEWDWCVALTLNPKMDFWVILCDYKGPEKYEPDDLSEAPDDLRSDIAKCRAHYRRRAILSTAKRYDVAGVQKVG